MTDNNENKVLNVLSWGIQTKNLAYIKKESV